MRLLTRPSGIRIVVYLLISLAGTALLYSDHFMTPEGRPVSELGVVLGGHTSQGLPVQGYARDGRLTSLVVSWRGTCSDERESTVLRTAFGDIRQRGPRFAAPGLNGRVSANGRIATGTFDTDAGLVRGDTVTVTCRSDVLGFRAGG